MSVDFLPIEKIRVSSCTEKNRDSSVVVLDLCLLTVIAGVIFLPNPIKTVIS